MPVNIPSDIDSLLVVRTVTVFLSADHCHPSIFSTSLTRGVTHAKKVRAVLQANGITVQTLRISIPGPAVFETPQKALAAAKQLDQLDDIDLSSLGCVHPSDYAFASPDFYQAVLATTSSVLISAKLDASPGVISRPATRAAATAVARLATLGEAGFSNFRFAASIHVPPGGPFFPTSYAARHAPGTQSNMDAASSQAMLPTVALGVQGGTLLAAVVSRSKSTTEALTTFQACVETGANRLVGICKKVDVDVKIDFSTAPLPQEGHGVGEPMRRLADVHTFPSAGGVTAVACVAAAIDAASFPRAGFCGIMLPVSEDPVLAAAPPRISDLMMCSAVCGTGLDTVPVPGDTSLRMIESVMLDVAALSCRLGCKPLTVRLMPVPGLRAGDMTQFSSPFFSNGPVVGVDEHFAGSSLSSESEGEEDWEGKESGGVGMLSIRAYGRC